MLNAFGVVLVNIVGLPIVKNTNWWKAMLLILLVFVFAECRYLGLWHRITTMVTDPQQNQQSS